MTELKITADAMILRGAEAPAPIVDRRLDGRLLVAAPGKKFRWIVLDQAPVPAPLAKRIKAPPKAVDERIVVPAAELDAVVAQVEAWLTGGGKEHDEKRAAAAAKAAETRRAKAEAKAAAERQAQWEAEAPAREAAAAVRAEAERARQKQLAEERNARELALAAQRRAEGARMEQLRANRVRVRVAGAPAVGEAFEVMGDEMWRNDEVVICQGLGRSWKQDGVEFCYAYTRPATAEEAAAYRADLPPGGHVIVRLDRAPAEGSRFKLDDGREVVAVSVGQPYRVDADLDEDFGSFYSSELWLKEVVRVDYEHVDVSAAAAEPAMVQQPVQQQQACAAPIAGMRPDDSVNAILDELIAACPPSPEPPRKQSDIARWSTVVGKDAARLRGLLDRAAAGEELSSEIATVEGHLSDARGLLAGYVEIDALGGLGRPYNLVPAWISPRIAVYRTADETLAFRYPRGLDRASVLALIDAYEAGCADGLRAAAEGR